MEFKNGKLTLTLHAQSPMIHFQYDQTGATLRASEVKPKLDKYLLSQIPKDERDESWFIGKSETALNYKLRIEDGNKVHEKILNIFPLYYGNMGENTVEKHFVFSDPTLTILCFNQKLQDFILKHLENFFLSHNFGTMQGKGFGSFVINKEVDDKTVKTALLSAGATKAVYKIAGFNQSIDSRTAADYIGIFRNIQTFYQLTKSGINHNGYARSPLFLYMHKKYKIGNEKAMVKQNNLVDFQARTERVSGHEHNSHDDSHPPHYIRALLGVGATQFSSPRYDDYVKISSSDIKRFSSPIRFKIINGKVFIYAVPIEEGLFGQRFTFTPSIMTEGHHEVELTVPAKNQFDIEGFLHFAAAYFNLLKQKSGVQHRHVPHQRQQNNHRHGQRVNQIPPRIDCLGILLESSTFAHVPQSISDAKELKRVL